jgi:hypothetical protein
LIIDLGEDKNVAGITGVWKHIAAHYRIDYSSDNTTWKQAVHIGSNSNSNINIPSDKHHFKGRYVRIYMANSRGQIFHPDDPDNFKNQGYVFGLESIQIWEHTGGGGAVGIQNLDGTEFNSIVWGQRQPGEWMLGSEKDVFTQDVGGGAFKQDQGNPAHIVLTWQKVWTDNPGMHRTQLRFYRNGLPYGEPYEKEVPAGRLTYVNNTRMVFGVRSSIFANETFDFNSIAGVHSLTHSPYFWGKIYNVTLLRNALQPEEVAGLYNVVKGGTELGCHCFDACPYGFNRFNRSVPVPCSGQGTCLRNEEGIPMASGKCVCLPGYSGDNCQDHCSELSIWGCCEIDDDCPHAHWCDRSTKACNNQTKVAQPGIAPFTYY